MNRLVGALCVLLTVSAGLWVAAQQSTGSIRAAGSRIPAEPSCRAP